MSYNFEISNFDLMYVYLKLLLWFFDCFKQQILKFYFKNIIFIRIYSKMCV